MLCKCRRVSSRCSFVSHARRRSWRIGSPNETRTASCELDRSAEQERARIEIGLMGDIVDALLAFPFVTQAHAAVLRAMRYRRELTRLSEKLRV